MASQLPPPPYKVPFTDENGLMTMPWVNWFKQVFAEINRLKAAVP